MDLKQGRRDYIVPQGRDSRGMLCTGQWTDGFHTAQ